MKSSEFTSKIDEGIWVRMPSPTTTIFGYPAGSDGAKQLDGYLKLISDSEASTL